MWYKNVNGWHIFCLQSLKSKHPTKLVEKVVVHAKKRDFNDYMTREQLKAIKWDKELVVR